MTLSVPTDRALRLGQLAVAVAACALLANCSAGNRIDPKYGVSASARVVEPGQPVPKGGGVYRVGKPYTVAGRTYVPEEDTNYVAEGMASWYGDDFHGRYTANGEIFDMNSISAAHPTLPLPSYARVTNLRNHRSIIVRINDRGPYAHNRIIDLSVKTAQLLGFYGHGLAKVKVEYVGRAPLAGSDDRKLMATLRDGDQPANRHQKQAPVMVASAGDFAPTYFDARPMSKVPSPPERPFAEEGANTVEADAAEPRTDAAAERAPASVGRTSVRAPERAPVSTPTVVARAMPPAAPAAERLTSPVSAYAPVRYDAPAGFMSGRGLY
jgi:rare lipoprotein A